MENLDSQEGDEARRRKAIILSQSAKGRNGFILFIPSNPEELMSQWELQCTLRTQLAEDPYIPDLRYCPLCGEHAANGDALSPMHAHSCRELKGGGKIKRHDSIRDVIYEFALELPPDKVAATKEPMALPGTQDRADILFVFSGVEKNYLDVRITHPTCKSYLRTAQQQLGAAKKAEQEKRRSYRAKGVPDNEIVPFVVESYGALGPDALKFIKKLASHHPHPSSWASRLYKAISVALQKGNALMIADWRMRAGTARLGWRAFV